MSPVALAFPCFILKVPVWCFGIVRNRLRVAELPGKVGSTMTALEGTLAAGPRDLARTQKTKNQNQNVLTCT